MQEKCACNAGNSCCEVLIAAEKHEANGEINRGLAQSLFFKPLMAKWPGIVELLQTILSEINGSLGWAVVDICHLRHTYASRR